jgi:flagellar basal body rod protein FlgG
MQILSIAQEGMQRADEALNQAAGSIASNGLPQTQLPADSLSLSDQMVSLMQAKNDFQANLKVAHTADETWKKTLDLFA